MVVLVERMLDLHPDLSAPNEKETLTMPNAVHIDGSFGEGGGQILRTSLSLSVITGRPVEIINIRAGRRKSGLQRQHLTAVHAAAALCDGEIKGAEVGSLRLTFMPRLPVRSDSFRFDVGTAGAATLVLQTALVPVCLAKSASRMTITGGTHVPQAPPAEYMEAVYLPALQRCGIRATCDYPSAGYYPKGGGEVHIDIDPASDLRPMNLTERGELQSLTAFVITSQLPDHVGERGHARVLKFMQAIGQSVRVERRDKPSVAPGAAVVLAAECDGGFAGFTGLGQRGKPMERVAEEACEAFVRWWKSRAACDEHLSDQLVLPMALASGESCWTTSAVTDHLRTVLHVAHAFLPIESSVEERSDGTGLVSLRGVGERSEIV